LTNFVSQSACLQKNPYNPEIKSSFAYATASLVTGIIFRQKKARIDAGFLTIR